MFKISDTLGSYRIYSEYGTLTAGIPYEHWTHKDKTQYFQTKEIKNAFLPTKSHYALDVWWFVPFVPVDGVQSGLYHVYLRHGAGAECSMTDETTTMFQVKKGDDFITVGTTHVFNDSLLEHLKSNSDFLVNTYQGTIDLTDFPQGESISLRVQIQNTNCDYPKGQWFFEGAILVPTTSIKTAPLQITLGKDKLFVKKSNEEVPVILIAGKKKLPPGFIEKEDVDKIFVADKLASAEKILGSEYNEGIKVRPGNLFSLDNNYYEGIDSCQFKLVTCESKGRGSYKVIAIVETEEGSSDEGQGTLGVHDIFTEGFLEEGYENGYYSWSNLQEESGKLVKVLHLDTNLGKITDQSKKCSASLTNFDWAKDSEVPDEYSLNWRWYEDLEGKWLAVITVE